MELLSLGLGVVGFITASVFFWPLFLVAILVASWSLENESFVLGTVLAFIVSVFLYVKLGLGDHVTSASGVAVAAVGYLVIGVVWAFTKWFVTLRKIRTEFITCRDSYMKSHSVTLEQLKHDVPSGFIRSLRENCKYLPHIPNGTSTFKDLITAIKPVGSENKARITAWITYWPLSLVGFVLNDAVREIVETAYNAVASRFQAMSDRMFKDLT